MKSKLDRIGLKHLKNRGQSVLVPFQVFFLFFFSDFVILKYNFNYETKIELVFRCKLVTHIVNIKYGNSIIFRGHGPQFQGQGRNFI